jgi:hypothetical protein
LETGSGGQKATAEKLKREGLAEMQWTRSLGLHNGRFLWITEAGRAAMASRTEQAAQPAVQAVYPPLQ